MTVPINILMTPDEIAKYSEIFVRPLHELDSLWQENFILPIVGKLNQGGIEAEGAVTTVYNDDLIGNIRFGDESLFLQFDLTVTNPHHMIEDSPPSRNFCISSITMCFKPIPQKNVLYNGGDLNFWMDEVIEREPVDFNFMVDHFITGIKIQIRRDLPFLQANIERAQELLDERGRQIRSGEAEELTRHLKRRGRSYANEIIQLQRWMHTLAKIDHAL
jgi:hypothetical protein